MRMSRKLFQISYFFEIDNALFLFFKKQYFHLFSFLQPKVEKNYEREKFE